MGNMDKLHIYYPIGSTSIDGMQGNVLAFLGWVRSTPIIDGMHIK